LSVCPSFSENAKLAILRTKERVGVVCRFLGWKMPFELNHQGQANRCRSRVVKSHPVPVSALRSARRPGGAEFVLRHDADPLAKPEFLDSRATEFGGVVRRKSQLTNLAWPSSAGSRADFILWFDNHFL
jgi:hypothetical protein